MLVILAMAIDITDHIPAFRRAKRAVHHSEHVGKWRLERWQARLRSTGEANTPGVGGKLLVLCHLVAGLRAFSVLLLCGSTPNKEEPNAYGIACGRPGNVWQG